jgi:curved DNA-binding protein
MLYAFGPIRDRKKHKTEQRALKIRSTRKFSNFFHGRLGSPMAVKYEDYYKILGVDRGATHDEIKRAYRKLARRYHPDINKDKSAEDKFKQINEAHEVLGDPEKRKPYDQLGSNWKAGQDFRPPPGWERVHYEFRGTPPGGSASNLGDFSEFFENIFAGRGPGRRTSSGGPSWSMRGQDHEATVNIRLEDAYHGANRAISLNLNEVDGQGNVRPSVQKINVRIPPGVTDGMRLRLEGKGGPGMGGGVRGDLFIRVRFEPHPSFRPSGQDLETDIQVTPWEAALGAQVEIPTMNGTVTLKVPAGTQSGQKLRLRGKGLPKREETEHGDLYATVKIAVPKELSPKEKDLFTELAKVSNFSPRKRT